MFEPNQNIFSSFLVCHPFYELNQIIPANHIARKRNSEVWKGQFHYIFVW